MLLPSLHMRQVLCADQSFQNATGQHQLHAYHTHAVWRECELRWVTGGTQCCSLSLLAQSLEQRQMGWLGRFKCLPTSLQCLRWTYVYQRWTPLGFSPTSSICLTTSRYLSQILDGFPVLDFSVFSSFYFKKHNGHQKLIFYYNKNSLVFKRFQEWVYSS